MNRLSVNTSTILTVLKRSLHKQRLRQLIVSFLIKHFALKIITREQLASGYKTSNTQFFGSEETVRANSPYSLEEVPEVIQSSVGEVVLEKPFVSEIENAKLVGATAVAFDQENRIILESVPGIDILPLRTLVLNKLSKAKPLNVDIACSLVNAHSKVYGHWVMDCLMRIEGIEHYQQTTGYKPILIVNSDLKAWQIDSLKLLGYESNDYLEWKWNTRALTVKKLVVPSFRRQGTWIEPKACRWLAQRMLSNLSLNENEEFTCSPRIYISRTKKLGRNILNENEVMELLAPLGFVSYTLETINFADEIKLFSQAEIIIGTHGSGLINMIYSRKQPIIIDLYSSWYTDLFFKLSASLGFQYACLKCQSCNQGLRLTRSNMIVDTVKLKQLIEEIIP